MIRNYEKKVLKYALKGESANGTGSASQKITGVSFYQ